MLICYSLAMCAADSLVMNMPDAQSCTADTHTEHLNRYNLRVMQSTYLSGILKQ
jgi:hypothetical protein